MEGIGVDCDVLWEFLIYWGFIYSLIPPNHFNTRVPKLGLKVFLTAATVTRMRQTIMGLLLHVLLGRDRSIRLWLAHKAVTNPSKFQSAKRSNTLVLSCRS
jgi:hypothetical protein